MVRWILYTALGIGISLMIGLIAWAISKDSIFSFIVTILIALIVLHIESRAKFEENREEFEKHIKEVLSELKLMPVFQKTEKSNICLKDIFVDMATDYQKIKSAKGDDYINKLYIGETENRFFKIRDEIREIKDGHLYVPQEEVTHILLELIKNTKQSFLATSLIPFQDFWGEDFGKKYREENKKLGNKVKRVFIIPDQSILEQEKYKILIKEQQDANIEVKIADINLIPQKNRKDFAIWDNKLVFYMSVRTPDDNVCSPIINHADIYIGSKAIEKAKSIFDNIHDNAHDPPRF